ncbi:MAG TPA: hypothetical protein VGE52_14355, partial [Pirellulales bacterium]
IIATSHGGFTMWLANNFYYYRFLKTHDWSETWDGVLPDGPVVYGVAPSQAPAKPGGAIELAYDEAYGRLAASAIASDPVGYRLATAHRLAKFWAIEPHREGHQESVKRQALRVAIGAWYALQFALAALGLIALLFRRREPGATAWFPAFLLIVAFTYAHSVYWSDLRMRGPIEPALALFAAAGLRAIVKRIRPAKTSSPSDEPIGSSPANDG